MNQTHHFGFYPNDVSNFFGGFYEEKSVQEIMWKWLIKRLLFLISFDRIKQLWSSFLTERRWLRLEDLVFQILIAVLGRVAGHCFCKLFDHIVEHIRKKHWSAIKTEKPRSGNSEVFLFRGERMEDLVFQFYIYYIVFVFFCQYSRDNFYYGLCWLC